MNLATARAAACGRAKSALRKMHWAPRRDQLVMQFLGESVLIALVALVLALALVEVLLPSYGDFMGRPLEVHYLADWPLMLGVLGIAILAGLLSGFYPALVLSGFRPAATLRANASGRSGSGGLRTALVVLQFAVSIGLGIGALVVFQQIEFARNIDLGFRHDNIVITGTGRPPDADGTKSFIHALERGPGIVQVVRTSFAPFYGNNSVLPIQRPGDAEFLSPNHISVSRRTTSSFTASSWRLAGRAVRTTRRRRQFLFEGRRAIMRDQGKNEGHNILVNDSALAHARSGYAPAEHPWARVSSSATSHVRVIGVVADTLSEGARSPALQTAYVYDPEGIPRFPNRAIAASGRLQEATDYIARTQRSFIHGVALSRNLLSDNYDRLYQSDERQGRIFAIFVGIAIFIASLGLFGLAAFTASRRTKEIGIRKVFGARVRDVVLLLLWQFSIPVLVANLIAWPIAWYYLHGWLEGFVYRITLNPLYFLRHRRSGAGHCLGDRPDPRAACGRRQSHQRIALRVGPCSGTISPSRCATSSATSCTASSISRGWRWGWPASF